MDYNKMLNSSFEEAIVGIIIVDKKGVIVHNNPYLETLFGYEKGELKGEKLEILLPNNYKKAHVNYRDKYLENPKPRAMGTHQELYGIKKSGSKFPVEISLSYTTIDNELLAIGYVTDDTSKKAILNELRESKSRLDEAQKLAHLGNFEIDWRLKETIWSNEMYEIFELTKDETKKLKFDDLINFIHPDDKEEVIKDLNQMVLAKSGSELDYRIVTANGKLKYLHGKRDVRLDSNGEIKAIVGVLQDVSLIRRAEISLNKKISEIKKVETELLQLNEALELKVEERTAALEENVNRLLTTNSKLEESELQLKNALHKEKELNELKSRFVSMASHEFRTPLSTISSSASLIAMYTKEEEIDKRKKHIERIKSSVNNLTGILNDFLSLSKIEEGKEAFDPAQIDLIQLCLEIEDNMKGLLKEGQEVVHNYKANKLLIYSDQRILKNILFNLMSNAIKYSPSNSTIVCGINNEKSTIKITISDAGIGIPQEDQKHIFSRFFRASNVENIQGTGLGLNIVKRYVELLGGSISFLSEHSKGTTFTIILPKKYEEDSSN